MENKVAETESPVVVESKVEELKRKSMDSKVTNDHDNQNGNDEPITKKVKTAENGKFIQFSISLDDNSDDVDTLHGTNGNKNGNVGMF